MNLSFSKSHRYYMYGKAADMRKGCDGLSGLVRNEFLQNPLSGDVFIFLNHRGSLIKLLQWQGDGFAIFYKRLEKGTYEIPQINCCSSGMEISSQQLLLILEGISLLHIRKRVRFQHDFVHK